MAGAQYNSDPASLRYIIPSSQTRRSWPLALGRDPYPVSRVSGRHRLEHRRDSDDLGWSFLSPTTASHASKFPAAAAWPMTAATAPRRTPPRAAFMDSWMPRCLDPPRPHRCFRRHEGLQGGSRGNEIRYQLVCSCKGSKLNQQFLSTFVSNTRP